MQLLSIALGFFLGFVTSAAFFLAGLFAGFVLGSGSTSHDKEV